MSNETKPNDAAFASDLSAGLTKRECFAAMAMQGILAAGKHGNYFERIANDSKDLADALIEALNRKPE